MRENDTDSWKRRRILLFADVIGVISKCWTWGQKFAEQARTQYFKSGQWELDTSDTRPYLFSCLHSIYIFTSQFLCVLFFLRTCVYLELMNYMDCGFVLQTQLQEWWFGKVMCTDVFYKCHLVFSRALEVTKYVRFGYVLTLHVLFCKINLVAVGSRPYTYMNERARDSFGPWHKLNIAESAWYCWWPVSRGNSAVERRQMWWESTEGNNPHFNGIMTVKMNRMEFVMMKMGLA